MHAIHVEFMCKQAALKALVNNLLQNIVRMFSVGVERISRKLPFEELLSELLWSPSTLLAREKKKLVQQNEIFNEDGFSTHRA